MNAIFVTGIGTDVGKTVASAILVEALQADYWKPIQEKLSGIHKVYFSPDGIYHLINISTLKNPVSGNYVEWTWSLLDDGISFPLKEAFAGFDPTGAHLAEHRRRKTDRRAMSDLRIKVNRRIGVLTACGSIGSTCMQDRVTI